MKLKISSGFLPENLKVQVPGPMCRALTIHLCEVELQGRVCTLDTALLPNQSLLWSSYHSNLPAT